MKKLFLLIVLALTCSIVYGQVVSKQLKIDDFINASSAKITYDEDFTPILNMEFKNISQKTITTIEVSANYKGYDKADYFAPICTKMIKTNIAPNQKQSLTVKLDKHSSGNAIKDVWINKIRFSDGTIIDK